MLAAPKTTCLVNTFISGLSPVLKNGDLKQLGRFELFHEGIVATHTQQD